MSTETISKILIIDETGANIGHADTDTSESQESVTIKRSDYDPLAPLEQLSDRASLKYLKLDRFQVSHQSLERFADCHPEIEQLAIINRRTYLANGMVDDYGPVCLSGRGLQPLVKLTALKELTITNTWVDDDGMLFVCELRNLEGLDLSGNPLYHFMIMNPDTREWEDRRLEQLNRLRSINLANTHFDEHGIANIRQYLGRGSLEALNLEHTLVNGYNLLARYLREVPTLRNLRVSSPHLREEQGIISLSSMTQLTRLELPELPPGLKDAVVQLEKELPDCKIIATYK